MNPRIEKKLSKRLVEVAPHLFRGAWKSTGDDQTELAESVKSSVGGAWMIGGETDYWGETTDALSVWDWLSMNWEWLGDFPAYPAGHELAHYPDTTGFRATAPNLLKLAMRINAAEKSRPGLEGAGL